MTKCVPIIAVADVEKSSSWYQELLNCQGMHGGDVFEMLADEDNSFFLYLHKWDEHEHPTLSNSKAENGNGVILYITVKDISAVWKKAQSMNLQIEKPLGLNENSGKEEFSIRDLDNYYLMISA